MTTTAASRSFDLLVYGATGYTGKKVCQYLVDTYPNFSIAVAGRTESKLRQVASELKLPPSHILVASLQDDNEQHLINTVSKARMVLACAGPYRHCGMPLVQACIKGKTDYLDLCGEPQFFDDCLVECDQEARTNQVLVVSACGFDSVPAELSAALVARTIREQRRGDNKTPKYDAVTGIEVCHTFAGIAKANVTTFHAAVDGFHAASNGALKESRNRVTQKFQLEKPKRTNSTLPHPPSMVPTFHKLSNSYIMKFPGADAAAIRASWRYLQLRQRNEEEDTTTKQNSSTSVTTQQPKLSVCFGCSSQWTAWQVLSYGAVFSTLAYSSWGCNLLHRYPSLFTNGTFGNPPTDEELNEGSFCTYTVGYGRDSTTQEEKEAIRVTCRGPEPGYVATPRILVALAVTILKHRAKLPFRGGVMLPGALLGDCDEAYDLLRENSIAFELIEDDLNPS